MSTPRIVRAPWTPEQVQALNLYQDAGVMHGYTCGAKDNIKAMSTGETADCQAMLRATEAGWVCTRPGCDYTQDWAHEAMADLDTVRDMVGESAKFLDQGTTKHP